MSTTSDAGEMAYRAYHDEHTGLPNRAMMVDRLEQAIDERRPCVDRGDPRRPAGVREHLREDRRVRTLAG